MDMGMDLDLVKMLKRVLKLLYLLMDHIHQQLLVLLLGQRLDLLDQAKQLGHPLYILVLHRLLN